LTPLTRPFSTMDSSQHPLPDVGPARRGVAEERVASTARRFRARCGRRVGNREKRTPPTGRPVGEEARVHPAIALGNDRIEDAEPREPARPRRHELPIPCRAGTGPSRSRERTPRLRQRRDRRTGGPPPITTSSVLVTRTHRRGDRQQQPIGRRRRRSFTAPASRRRAQLFAVNPRRTDSAASCTKHGWAGSRGGESDEGRRRRDDEGRLIKTAAD